MKYKQGYFKKQQSYKLEIILLIIIYLISGLAI